MKIRIFAIPAMLGLVALSVAHCATPQRTESRQPAVKKEQVPAPTMRKTAVARAIFAGGCFWCMQPPYDRLPGVISTTVGYTGGRVANPTYEQVSTRRTKHVEAIEVRYDPTRVTYEKLLDVYWRSIDPTDAGGQFADRGPHYRPAIFYLSPEQKRAAEKSRAALARSGRFKKPIVVAVLPARQFYAAEKYHQRYYRKNPRRYQSYKCGSGRATFLERVWGTEAKTCRAR